MEVPKEEKPVILSWGRLFRKTRGEVIIFVGIIIAATLLLPKAALVGLLSLMASKVLSLTIAVFLAHLFRILAFPYLDLSSMIEEKQWSGVMFITAWYVIIIWSIAVGG